jgi:hypothetical protein
VSESRSSHPVSDIIAAEYEKIVLDQLRNLNYWRERSGQPWLMLAVEVHHGKRKRTRRRNRKGS